MTWSLHHAFPVKLTSTSLNPDTNVLTIDILELACESITQTPVDPPPPA